MTIKFLRGTSAKIAAYLGSLGEVTINTDKKCIVVHDGVTLGGSAMATESGVQNALYSYAVAGGSADAITASFSPAITAVSGGLSFTVRVSAANASTTPTFTPASGTIAPAVVVKGNNLALSPGDFAGPGFIAELLYDSVLTKWVLMNPATGVTNAVADASTTVKGKVQIATLGEVQTGTDTLKAVTPATLAAATPGFGQGYQNFSVGSARVLGSPYTNGTGRQITVILSGVSGSLVFAVNGSTVHTSSAGTATLPVPPGATYSVSASGVGRWDELR